MIEICCSMVNHSIMNVDDNNRIQNEFLRKNNNIFFSTMLFSEKEKRLRIKSEDVFVFEINANHFMVHIWGRKRGKITKPGNQEMKNIRPSLDEGPITSIIRIDSIFLFLMFD